MLKLVWMGWACVIALGLGGCVVTTSDDDDDSCLDSDGDGYCNVDDCAPNDPLLNVDCGCTDSDGDGICDSVDCDPNDPTNANCNCIDTDGDLVCDEDDCDPNDPLVIYDTDGDGYCDEDDCYPNDPLEWDCCNDADWDGVCDDVDCYPDDFRVWDCDCADTDGDTVCDDVDKDDCVDDLTGEYLCVEVCTADNNICTTPWDLWYCAEGSMWEANCAVSCVEDDRVYGDVCGGIPAITGECSPDDGACLCWCEDSFDSCVDEWTVQYTRDQVTYQVHCGQYCGGICDADLGACACPG